MSRWTEECRKMGGGGSVMSDETNARVNGNPQVTAQRRAVTPTSRQKQITPWPDGVNAFRFFH